MAGMFRLFYLRPAETLPFACIYQEVGATKFLSFGIIDNCRFTVLITLNRNSQEDEYNPVLHTASVLDSGESPEPAD